MNRSFVYAGVVSCAVCAHRNVHASPFSFIVETATIAHEDDDLLLKIEFEVGLEKGNEVERGFIHPEDWRMFVTDFPISWLGAYAFAEVGKSGGHGHAGFALRPLAIFDVEDPTVDIGIGGGLGAGGVPIVGWLLRVEADVGIQFFAIGHYHIITGLDQSALFRARAYPMKPWFVEAWWGVSTHVAGKEQLYDTLEGEPFLGVQFRWPIHVFLKLGWPFLLFDKRYDPRLRLGLEFEF